MPGTVTGAHFGANRMAGASWPDEDGFRGNHFLGPLCSTGQNSAAAKHRFWMRLKHRGWPQVGALDFRVFLETLGWDFSKCVGSIATPTGYRKRAAEEI